MKKKIFLITTILLLACACSSNNLKKISLQHKIYFSQFCEYFSYFYLIYFLNCIILFLDRKNYQCWESVGFWRESQITIKE